MSAVGRWHRWLRWIRVNHSQPSAFIAARSVARYPTRRAARSVARYPTRRAATYRLKACRPVPCPPLQTARLEVVPVSGLAVPCHEHGQVKIRGFIYAEAVTTPFPGGSFTDPPRLVGWQLGCNCVVSGDDVTLVVNLVDGQQTATWLPRTEDERNHWSSGLTEEEIRAVIAKSEPCFFPTVLPLPPTQPPEIP